jgi:phosphoribosylformimino-5-aminoimidazole carboxamide ribotide isomerase
MPNTDQHPMEIIPALDLKSGKCVRLLQGRDDATTEYSDDPVAVAAKWVRDGAKRLHVVNLDGAFGRASKNLEVLRGICQRTEAIVQFGGGLRTLEGMQEALEAGAAKVVVGTVAVESPEVLGAALSRFGEEKIIVALDAVEGRVAVRGWTVISGRSVADLTRELMAKGVREILYTDVKRDGMLSGPDLETLRELGSIGVRVLASGGVSSAVDIQAIARLNRPQIAGVIVGKALYEGRVTLPGLISAARDYQASTDHRQ